MCWCHPAIWRHGAVCECRRPHAGGRWQRLPAEAVAVWQQRAAKLANAAHPAEGPHRPRDGPAADGVVPDEVRWCLGAACWQRCGASDRGCVRVQR